MADEKPEKRTSNFDQTLWRSSPVAARSSFESEQMLTTAMSKPPETVSGIAFVGRFATRFSSSEKKAVIHLSTSSPVPFAGCGGRSGPAAVSLRTAGALSGAAAISRADASFSLGVAQGTSCGKAVTTRPITVRVEKRIQRRRKSHATIPAASQATRTGFTASTMKLNRNDEEKFVRLCAFARIASGPGSQLSCQRSAAAARAPARFRAMSSARVPIGSTTAAKRRAL